MAACPEGDLLLGYSSGSIGEGWSLVIATHIALCPKCRDFVSSAELMGGALLDEIKPAPVTDMALDHVLMKLGKQESLKVPPKPSRSPIFPEPLRKYVGGDFDKIAWKSIGGGFLQCLLSTGDSSQVRLLSIPAGRRVPEHDHRGRELTLVLSGGFSDHTGTFVRGDLEDADEELTHSPIADSDENCICLAVTDAPLKFRSIVPQLVQPFIRI